MARYAIDRAIVERREGSGEVTISHIQIEAPYPKEKFMLLGAAARANRCRAILGVDDASFERLLRSPAFDDPSAGRIATVIGYRSDLEAVELLFTSLTLQAVNVMLGHGSIVSGGRNRTRSFRRSFIIGFAHTVNERLRAVQEQAIAAAASSAGGDLLPVLAERDREVEHLVNTTFPHLSSLRTSLSNRAGLAAGRRAAAAADIGTTRLTRSHAALDRPR
ncbi:MAG: hypothetical protein HKN26_07250, partial [Acidimicrobiales bacterium]|nr:hypothetical protein [Acidimicrobiales bacterium]